MKTKNLFNKIVAVFVVLIAIATALPFLAGCDIDNPNAKCCMHTSASPSSVTFESLTQMPMIWYNPNCPYSAQEPIEGIEFIPWYRVTPNFNFVEQGLLRITTFNAFASFLNLAVEQLTNLNYRYALKESNDVLLQEFDTAFFETNDLLIIIFTGGLTTLGLRLDNITEYGEIQITEFRCNRHNMVLNLGVGFSFAISIESNITPNSFSFRLLGR